MTRADWTARFHELTREIEQHKARYPKRPYCQSKRDPWPYPSAALLGWQLVDRMLRTRRSLAAIKSDMKFEWNQTW